MQEAPRGAAIRTGCRPARLSRPRRDDSRRAGSSTPLGRRTPSPRTSRTLLADCFRNSLRIADELGAATVAFPAISTGVYRWPVDDAARIALETVRASDTRVDEVRFVLFDQSAYDVFTAQASKSEG